MSSVSVVTFDHASFVETSEPHRRKLRVMLSPALQNGSDGIAIGCTEIPPGQTTSAHVHDNSNEIWIVVAGEGRVSVGDLELDVGENTVIQIPKGIKHQIANSGSRLLRVYWIFQPDGPERAILRGELM